MLFTLTAHFGSFSLVFKKDAMFEATRLHFENLVMRYGNPIIILNLIKVGISTCVRKSLTRFYFSISCLN